MKEISDKGSSISVITLGTGLLVLGGMIYLSNIFPGILPQRKPIAGLEKIAAFVLENGEVRKDEKKREYFVKRRFHEENFSRRNNFREMNISITDTIPFFEETKRFDACDVLAINIAGRINSPGPSLNDYGINGMTEMNSPTNGFYDSIYDSTNFFGKHSSAYSSDVYTFPNQGGNIPNCYSETEANILEEKLLEFANRVLER